MKPSEKFTEIVKARIDGDMQHGWGVDDSMAVIAALWEEETGSPLDMGEAETGGLIKAVVNPSAFRQRLESKGKLAKPVKGEKRNSAVGSLLDF